jgi:threonine/homoserine/homoserine lactone efflux protein
MELMMFPIEVFIAYTTACMLLVLSPGPDNLLAVGRGLSQGKLAALVSGLTFLGSGFAIALMRHR